MHFILFTVFTCRRFDSCTYLFLTAVDIVHPDSHKGCRGSQKHYFVGVTVVVFEGSQGYRVSLPRSLHAISCCFELLSLVNRFPVGN